MNAVSPICLVDLAPALRWSKSPDVAPLLRHDRLIDGWWHSLPVARALDIAGPPWLAQSIARLAVQHWGHVPLFEFLPTLRTQPVDCTDLAEPVRGAVMATAGDWDRLIAACPQEISSWPLPGCGVLDIVGAVAWRALRVCGDLPDGPTLPRADARSRTHHRQLAPRIAPDHVRKRWTTSITTGSGHADGTENDPEHEQTPRKAPPPVRSVLRAARPT